MACKMDGEWKKAALDDPDLKAMQDDIAAMPSHSPEPSTTRGDAQGGQPKKSGEGGRLGDGGD